MVLTAQQTTAFFEDDDQMGIPHATVIQMQVEGIDTVDDLAEFRKDDLNQLADNLRRPGGRIPDLNPGAAAGATIPTPAFQFCMRSQKRLLVACDLVRYHNECGRTLTATNVRWTHVMRNFEIQWKALIARKAEDEPDVPKVSKGLPIIAWSVSMTDCLRRIIGVRYIPLVYLIRENCATVPPPPPLAQNLPHSNEHGSVEAELIARASHTHPLYREDNAKLYFLIELALRGTQYAPSIQPFQATQDGVGAWTTIIAQFAGVDKWEAEIKKQDELLHSRIWRGQNNFALEHFVAQHRNAFVLMKAGAQHVNFQLPNEHTRVGYIIDNIEC